MTLNNLSDRLKHVVYQKYKGKWVMLAHAAGMSPTSIQSVKNGSDMRQSTLLRICDAMNVNADWLLTGEGETYRNAKHQVSTPGAKYQTGTHSKAAAHDPAATIDKIIDLIKQLSERQQIQILYIIEEKILLNTLEQELKALKETQKQNQKK